MLFKVSVAAGRMNCAPCMAGLSLPWSTSDEKPTSCRPFGRGEQKGLRPKVGRGPQVIEGTQSRRSACPYLPMQPPSELPGIAAHVLAISSQHVLLTQHSARHNLTMSRSRLCKQSKRAIQPKPPFSLPFFTKSDRIAANCGPCSVHGRPAQDHRAPEGPHEPISQRPCPLPRAGRARGVDGMLIEENFSIDFSQAKFDSYEPPYYEDKTVAAQPVREL